MKLILASSSPNRRELFDRLGVAYEIAHPDYEEAISTYKPPHEQVKEFALGKALSVYKKIDQNEDVLILGFDSMIAFENQSVGKPKTKKAAFEMIQRFVGKEQAVVTGISIVGHYKGKYFEKTEAESTKVVFRSDVTNCQIRRYLEYGDFKDKCGAYSILGTGIFLLEKIEGDFQNIIGVPVIRLGNMIRVVTGKSPLWILETQ